MDMGKYGHGSYIHKNDHRLETLLWLLLYDFNIFHSYVILPEATVSHMIDTRLVLVDLHDQEINVDFMGFSYFQTKHWCLAVARRVCLPKT